MTRAGVAGDLERFARAYAAFIGSLSEHNASPLWWALSLPGKNPLQSPLPERAWRRLRGEPSPPAPAGAKVLANRLLPLGPMAGFVRALVRWLKVRAACAWTPEAGRRYAVIATLVNQQSFGNDGAYRDTYFGELSLHLERRGLTPVVFGHFTSDFDRSVRRSRGQAGPPIVPMERFLSIGDLLSCLATAMSVRLFGFGLRGPTQLAGIEMADLIREEIAENARASRLFDDLWYGFCARAFLRRVPVERLYLPYENRAWERMLTLAVRELAPGVPVIGYQHASTTDNHLNYVLGPGEEKTLPLPDKIVAMGEVTRDRLIARGGYPERLVELGCALRQPAPRATRETPAAARRLLATLATSPAEYLAVLALIESAFPPGAGPEILVRPHPEFALPPTRLRVEPSWTVQQSLDWADIVLYASSTLGLEAVRQGVPVVQLGVSGFFSLDPMGDFDALKWTARTSGELCAAIDAIAALAPEDLARRRRQAVDYASRYLRQPDSASLEPLLSPSPVLEAMKR